MPPMLILPRGSKLITADVSDERGSLMDASDKAKALFTWHLESTLDTDIYDYIICILAGINMASKRNGITF